jgi:uncharacterized damage-inducible protein DinB
MAEDRDDLLRHYAQMRADLLAAIEGLSDELMVEPSIDGWSVKDHLLHIAFWDDLRSAEVTRISAGHESAWRLAGEQEDSLNAIVYERRRGLPLAQARWELADSRRRLVDAISSATPRGLDGSLYGEAGLRSTHEGAHTGWIRRWRKEKGL